MDLRAEIVGEDEVALLARSFNEFMDQLNRSGDIFQLGELRVLVVEDNLGHRHLIEELLGNWRMRAVAASDGAAAVAAIRAAEDKNDPVQLVVLDADMAALREQDFIDALLRLKQRHACTDQASFRNRQLLFYNAARTQNAALADSHIAGDVCVTADETVVPHAAPVSDVASVTNDHVVANHHTMLNHSVRPDDAVLADGDFWIDDRTRMDVRNE